MIDPTDSLMIAVNRFIHDMANLVFHSYLQDKPAPKRFEIYHRSAKFIKQSTSLDFPAGNDMALPKSEYYEDIQSGFEATAYRDIYTGVVYIAMPGTDLTNGKRGQRQFGR